MLQYVINSHEGVVALRRRHRLGGKEYPWYTTARGCSVSTIHQDDVISLIGYTLQMVSMFLCTNPKHITNQVDPCVRGYQRLETKVHVQAGLDDTLTSFWEQR